MRFTYLAVTLLCLLSPVGAFAQDTDAAQETTQETDIEVPDDTVVEDKDDAAPPAPAPVNKDAPFKELPGRWVGEGRLGLTDGKTESVKCRATYFVNAPGNELKQNIRCASASGKIEVKSVVNAKDGKLSGTWNELVYNLGGEMNGDVTQRGFRIAVRAGDQTANMDVIVMNDRQIVEIQFFSSALRGLTLILKKG
jgi:hypothetical protein